MAARHSTLTAEFIRSILNYDADTGQFVWAVLRGGQMPGSTAGSQHHKGYVNISVSSRLYQAHRLAWLHVYGEWPHDEVDHINGVRNDNRIANLRVVGKSLNLQNQKRAQAGSTSGYLGVYPTPRSKHNPWMARIVADKKILHLGVFPTKEDAYEAYLQAKRRLHLTNTL